jgi:hypothetical protein
MLVQGSHHLFRPSLAAVEMPLPVNKHPKRPRHHQMQHDPCFRLRERDAGL